ncbi:MAG: hypothetical protein BWY30_00155 [Tenericutes bacterium ADurb.Bin239]|nr:MAG: hypothetical protein BWY30_00155 [Tenericutes bacterium ADurb.Bin239]
MYLNFIFIKNKENANAYSILLLYSIMVVNPNF